MIRSNSRRVREIGQLVDTGVHGLDASLPIMLRNRLRHDLRNDVGRQRRSRHASLPKQPPAAAVERRKLCVAGRQLRDFLHHRNRTVRRLHLVNPSAILVERRDVDCRADGDQPPPAPSAGCCHGLMVTSCSGACSMMLLTRCPRSRSGAKRSSTTGSASSRSRPLGRSACPGCRRRPKCGRRRP